MWSTSTSFIHNMMGACTEPRWKYNAKFRQFQIIVSINGMYHKMNTYIIKLKSIIISMKIMIILFDLWLIIIILRFFNKLCNNKTCYKFEAICKCVLMVSFDKVSVLCCWI
jgi:hypothetical protein